MPTCKRSDALPVQALDGHEFAHVGRYRVGVDDFSIAALRFI